MKIFITGATGFIGRNLVERLKRELFVTDILGMARHFQDYNTIPCLVGEYTSSYLKSYLSRYKPDCIIHLAANPLVKDANFDEHVNTTRLLLEASPADCRFIFASSATVYGNSICGVHDEEHPCTPNSIYGLAKLTCEQFVDLYTRQGRIKGINLRLVANVGKYATHGLLKDVIKKLKGKSKQLELLGEKPGSIKPYCHVSDTVDAIVEAAQSKHVGSYNIGPDNEISVEYVAIVAMEELGIKKEIKWLGASSVWQGDDKYVGILNRKAELILKWKPYYSFSEDAVSQAVRDIVNE